MVAVPHQQVLRTGGTAGRDGVAVLGRAGGEVERLLECLVALSEDLLTDVREVADLAERARDMRLSTRDEDARRDDRLQRLAAEQFLLVRSLVQLFRDIGDGFGEGELVTPAGDVTERLQKVAF